MVKPTKQAPQRTIAAVATPPGDGGVGIIRISGADSLLIGTKIFSKSLDTLESRVCHFGKILTKNLDLIDEVLLIIMRNPNSYTGEDVVEIQCHGGHLIVQKVLERVLEAGAEPAQAGEFTFRAFMNGKLDLAQAESIQALIGAKNERALEAAKRHLEGALSKKVLQFKQELTDIAAILEAWVDFPEEGLEFASLEEIIASLSHVQTNIESLIKTYHDGKIASEGLHIALIGAPNVGKSSLMNALLKKERAIVSHIPGTTRDLVEDHLFLNGLNVRLTDTAGIRDSSDLIEEEGIRRSKKILDEADLILAIMDAEKGVNQEIISLIPQNKSIFIWNKIDLQPAVPPVPFERVVTVSALKLLGLDDLKAMIDRVIWDQGPPSKEEILITNLRHKEALLNASLYLKKAINGLQTEVSPEFLTFDVRQALVQLGTMIGSDIQEEILSSIFRKFCVGK